ncbi:MAG: hypothetical protein CM15mP79_0830 [Methanobacteriota archaeon]|nr:MAG: hypothetical protein CM15mP79_0830 [Euryarchaeota archaeon]
MHTGGGRLPQHRAGGFPCTIMGGLVLTPPYRGAPVDGEDGFWAAPAGRARKATWNWSRWRGRPRDQRWPRLRPWWPRVRGSRWARKQATSFLCAHAPTQARPDGTNETGDEAPGPPDVWAKLKALRNIRAQGPVMSRRAHASNVLVGVERRAASRAVPSSALLAIFAPMLAVGFSARSRASAISRWSPMAARFGSRPWTSGERGGGVRGTLWRGVWIIIGFSPLGQVALAATDGDGRGFPRPGSRPSSSLRLARGTFPGDGKPGSLGQRGPPGPNGAPGNRPADVVGVFISEAARV